MKKLTYFFASLIILSTLSCQVELFSCLKGEGDIETRTIDLDDITGIEIGLDAEVVISEGPTQEITIEAHGNVIDRLLEDSKIAGNTWEVETNGCSDLEVIKIFLTLPTIEVASIKGSGAIRTENQFQNIDKINLEIDGDGDIDFKLATANKVDIEIKGTGRVMVSGSTIDQSIDVSGSGTIRNFGLDALSTDIEVSGDVDCNVAVENILRIDLSGSGRICYKGTPTTLTIDNSGSVQLEDCN